MSDRWQSPCGRMELRLGDYREALADVRADHCITDPPYSARIHEGQRTGASTRKTTLTYDGWARDDAAALWFWASERVRLWRVVFSDHQLQRWHEEAADANGLYVFAPVLYIRQCPTPRLAGDGPTSAADYMTVARPRMRLPSADRGSRPGYYVSPHSNGPAMKADSPHPGGKLLAPMRAIVRDYSRPGDLIVDPCAGGGTTLLAAAIEGRRAIGAELDPETYAKAVERLSRGYTPAMVPADPLTGEQGGLL